MPKSKKKPAKSGTNLLFSNVLQPKKQGFDPIQGRRPSGLKNQARNGGKPKLFPGRTGGR